VAGVPNMAYVECGRHAEGAAPFGSRAVAAMNMPPMAMIRNLREGESAPNLGFGLALVLPICGLSDKRGV
jgi:hypothetical protein